MLELDVNNDADLEALTGSLRERWGSVDGALHAIAFAPEDALGGRFLTTPPESASAAFQTSAFSLKALAVALEPLMGDGVEHRRARLRRDRRMAGLRLDGRREGRARVGLAVSGTRPRASRDPGEPRIGRAAWDGRGARAFPASRGWPSSGAPRLRSGGTSRIRRPSPTRSASCCRTTRERSAARSSTSTAAFTRSAPRVSRRSAFAGRSSSARTTARTTASGGPVDAPRIGRSGARWRLASLKWTAGSPTSASYGFPRCSARWRSRSRASWSGSVTPRRRRPRSSAARSRSRSSGCWPGSRIAGSDPGPGPSGASRSAPACSSPPT